MRCRVMSSVGSDITAWSLTSASSRRIASRHKTFSIGPPVHKSSRLALYHFWVAFGLFVPAVLLGAWQMWMRSPSPAPLHDRPDTYYASVTLHGTIMAYVLTTRSEEHTSELQSRFDL